jgi:hypothetical protein
MDSFWRKWTAHPRQENCSCFCIRAFLVSLYVPKEEWKGANVYRHGCIADGKCEILAPGTVWLDDELTRDSRRVVGKYEIEFNGKHLRGQFAATLRGYKHPPRICM